MVDGIYVLILQLTKGIISIINKGEKSTVDIASMIISVGYGPWFLK